MKNKIAIVLPVRDAGLNRFKRVVRCLKSYYEYTEGFSDIHILHDKDECKIYHQLSEQYPQIINYCIPTGISLMEKINIHAIDIAKKYKYIGFVGDDIVFKTPFEKLIIEHLSQHNHAMAFGNDLIWNGKLPTHPFMTSKTILAVGFFGCPAVEHNFFDNYWGLVFETLKTKKYIPEIIMEHMHMMVAKEENDALTHQIWEKLAIDKIKYTKYIENNFNTDLEKIKSYE